MAIKILAEHKRLYYPGALSWEWELEQSRWSIKLPLPRPRLDHPVLGPLPGLPQVKTHEKDEDQSQPFP